MSTLDMLRRLMVVVVLATFLGGVLVAETNAAAGVSPRSVAHANFSF